MSKERLEEIVAVVESQKESVRKLSHNDLNWLIEQAERVQELEERERKLININQHELKYRAELETKYVNSEQQNKRYREALEFYADERNYKERDFGMIVQPAIQDGDKGKTARKALEGEK